MYSVRGFLGHYANHLMFAPTRIGSSELSYSYFLSKYYVSRTSSTYLFSFFAYPFFLFLNFFLSCIYWDEEVTPFTHFLRTLLQLLLWRQRTSSQVYVQEFYTFCYMLRYNLKVQVVVIRLYWRAVLPVFVDVFSYHFLLVASYEKWHIFCNSSLSSMRQIKRNWFQPQKTLPTKLS